MSKVLPWIQNDFYALTTPIPSPMIIGGFRLLASMATCRKCGRGFTQAIRVHLVHNDIVTGFSIAKDMPSEEKLATSFMVKACDNGVGCWKTCRPWKHMKTCQMPSMRLILRHNPRECFCKTDGCTCPVGCGNQGIYPCRCGHAFGLHKGVHQVGCPAIDGGECQCNEFGRHKAGCSVGAFKRTSSFEVSYVRSLMVGPGK